MKQQGQRAGSVRVKSIKYSFCVVCTTCLKNSLVRTGDGGKTCGTDDGVCVCVCVCGTRNTRSLVYVHLCVHTHTRSQGSGVRGQGCCM
jgi:hypothetical protein